MIAKHLFLPVALIALCTCAAGSSVAAADTGEGGTSLKHPVHGHKADPIISSMYLPGMGLPAEWSIGDITFPDSYPPLSSLTEEEKYIIVGSRSSAWRTDSGLADWAGQIYSIVSRYYEQYGKVPDVLTPEAVRSIRGLESYPEDGLCEFLNPLTDEWPRLNAVSPSPGDVYIRPLTREEMDFYSSQVPTYRDIWFRGRQYDPECDEYIDAQLTGKVFYLRVYGWSGVILANFMYSWTV